jgi:hypothetical protein
MPIGSAGRSRNSVGDDQAREWAAVRSRRSSSRAVIRGLWGQRWARLPREKYCHSGGITFAHRPASAGSPRRGPGGAARRGSTSAIMPPSASWGSGDLQAKTPGVMIDALGGIRALVCLWLRGDGLFLCCACRRQTSPTAGTVLDKTRLPLSKWLQEIWYVTEETGGVSALSLQRSLGLGSYKRQRGRCCTSCAERWSRPRASSKEGRGR